MTSRREFLMQSAAACIGAAAAVGAAHAARRNPGVVHTVQGPIDASKLGFTLPHEHICVSSAGFWQVWPEFFGGRTKFSAKVVDKLKAARDEGVDTLVDVTPADVGRDVRLLEEVSRKSGVQIVACTGHWLFPSLTMSARAADELAEFFVLEIERGIEGTDIKAGVIKIATDHEGVTPFLEKALRAAARASKATGIPITTHTNAADRTAEKQVAIFEEEGVDPASVCLGHCDDSSDITYLTGLAKRGYTLGMDHLTWSARGNAQMPTLSLQQRAESIRKLIDAGFVERIFLSNDWYFGVSMAPVGTMEALEALNPDGLLFTTRKAIPQLQQLGITERQIRTMTVENPRRFFGAR